MGGWGVGGAALFDGLQRQTAEADGWVFTLLSYLKPGAYEEMSDVVPHHITDPEQQVGPGCFMGIMYRLQGQKVGWAYQLNKPAARQPLTQTHHG